MTSTTKCLEDEYQRDLLWIHVFGEPYRDCEMLLWDNLEWDSKFKIIRCKTCGCPKELDTCPKTTGDKGN